MCSQRHIKQREQPSGAPPTARLSKCTISSVTRAWSGMTTLKPQQRSTHVLEHAQTHHGIPLHSKGVSSKHAAPQNSWRATNLSSIKMHHIERHTAVSAGASSTRTHAQKHPACLLGSPSKRLPGPICTQNVLTTYGTSESARISWTSEQTLAHQNASCRALHGS